MGTNYYHITRANECTACGRHDEERLHIGKSSAGWCFSLHTIPSLGINDLDDWRRRWEAGGTIEDEYGEAFPAVEMLRRITERSAPAGTWAPGELYGNHGAPGPNNLARHRTATPGAGTWDLCPWEFS